MNILSPFLYMGIAAVFLTSGSVIFTVLGIMALYLAIKDWKAFWQIREIQSENQQK